jgi:surface protein
MLCLHYLHETFYLETNFNQDINSWNVSQVTDMHGMFYHAGINIALNGGLSCGGIKLCPATQGAIHIIYSAGNDTLTGAGGRDIFDYGFKNAGNDTITDFTLGNTTTNTNADILIVFLSTYIPPLPIIARVGPVLSSTKLPLAIILVNKLAV